MSFTPFETSLGALFIQLATTNYYWQIGETIGFSSSIYNGLIKRNGSSISIILGIALSVLTIKSFFPIYLPREPYTDLTNSSNNTILFSVVGFIVGVGTKLGNGCTSGHMIGGISRLRVRSLIATTVFVLTGITTIYLLKIHPFGYTYGIKPLRTSLKETSHYVYWILGTSTILVYVILPRLKVSKVIHGVFSGWLFGLGLHISGMVHNDKPQGFLSVLDPSLVFIMVFTIVPNIFIWRKINKPLISDQFNLANSNEISYKFIVGNVLFGIGWGVLGICPGPGLITSFHFTQVRYWLGSFLVGYWTGGIV